MTHPEVFQFFILVVLTSSQAKGDVKQDKAQSEQDASRTIGKLGPYNVSSSGGVSKDDPRRAQGNWDQTAGSAKETIGNALGMEGMKKEGQEQNAQGKSIEAEGQLSDFGSGIKDRAEGRLGGVGASITGDREAEEKYRMQHDDGKTAQRSAEHDIQKQAEA